MARNTEIQVGVAVIAALAIVIWGVTWLSDVHLARQRHDYIVRFTDVGGLAEGDPVTVNGVAKGKVLSIDLTRGGAAVHFGIDRSVRLNHGSRVIVRNSGLMGEKFIAIVLADDGAAYGPRDTIPGQYESGVPEVISQMGDALVSLERVSGEVDRILALAEERGTVRTTLRNMEDASTHLNQAVTENREDLRAITTNLREVSSQIHMLVSEKGPVVDKTVDRLAQTSGRVDTLVTRLDLAARSLSRLADRAQSDSTTVGRLMSDRALYDDLRRTIRDLNALTRDVRQNPRRYLKISLF